MKILAQHDILEAKPPQKIVRSVNRCIYFNEKCDTAYLTDEHIIPDGLGGDIVLERASCKICAAHTGRLEGYILRDTMRDARGVVGLKSRKKRAFGKQKQKFYNESSISKIETEVEYSEKSPMVLPSFVTCLPPLIMTGMKETDKVDLFSRFILPTDIVKRTTDIFSKGEYRLTYNMHAGVVGQMYAKIAHSFACAHLDSEEFSPFLINYISAKEPEFNAYLIGSSDPIAPQCDSYHRLLLYSDTFIKIEDGQSRKLCKLIFVEVQLFAMIGAPVFTLVVGESK